MKATQRTRNAKIDALRATRTRDQQPVHGVVAPEEWTERTKECRAKGHHWVKRAGGRWICLECMAAFVSHSLGGGVKAQPDHLLTYRGRLPNLNRDHHPWWGRATLKKACLRQWGELPRPMRTTRKARLEICRMLGPRERKTDFTNLTYRCKGLEDALVSGGYLVDDSPTWLEWPPLYWTDDQSREQGSRVEVRIWYK